METVRKGIAAIILLAAGISSCGYRASGVVAGGPSSLSVTPFVNRSYSPGAEAVLSAAIAGEFARHPAQWRLASGSADFVVTGNLVSYVVTPAAYSRIDEVTQYRLAATVEAILRTSAGQTRWKRTFSGEGIFPAHAFPVLQRDAESEAYRTVCEKIAREAYLASLDEF